MNAAACHRTILNSFFDPKPMASTRLVARLHDPILGNPDPTKVYFFVPDFHLVSDVQTLRYSYEFNEWFLCYKMLYRLLKARTLLQADGHELRVIHLGDLFDLWRQGSDDWGPIFDDHSTLLQLLYRDPTGLRARILVGNHDAGLLDEPEFDFRVFLAAVGTDAFGLATHGHWFDPLEMALPEWLKRFAVFVTGGIPQAKQYALDTRAALDQRAAAADQFEDRVQLSEPAAAGSLRKVGVPNSPMPAKEHNVSRTSRGDVTHPFLGRASEVVRTCRADQALAATWANMHLMVIGHTHHARISVDDTSDPAHPVVLMDCGAWIEGYKDANNRVGRNCQVGVAVGNDIRIYQLDPPSP